MKYLFIFGIACFIVAVCPHTPAWLFAFLATVCAVITGVLAWCICTERKP